MTAFFTAGQNIAGATGTNTLTITGTTTSGALSVANIIVADGTAFGVSTPPANWRLGNVSYGATGRVEQWYLLPEKNTGITNPVWTAGAGINIRGHIAEATIPSGYSVVLETVGGNGGGTGLSWTIKSAGGYNIDCAGFSVVAQFNTTTTTVVFTDIAAWGGLRSVSGVANNWRTQQKTDLTTEGTFTGTSGIDVNTNQTGWAGSVVFFRARRFRTIGLNGAEHLNGPVAFDPQGKVFITPGDVEGMHLTANKGEDHQLCMTDLNGSDSNNIGGVVWSQLEDRTVYALVGTATVGNQGAGFLVSTNGGVRWSVRSAAVVGSGGAVATPPRPTGVSKGTDRWCGRCIAQDSVNDLPNGHIYIVDADRGQPYRSNNLGATWTQIPLPAISPGPPYYLRTIANNPANPKELWAAGWKTTTTGASNGGVWHCPDGTVANPVWTQMSGWTGSVRELLVVGSHIYVAADSGGVYSAPVGTGPGTNTLTSKNGTGSWPNGITTGTVTGGPFCTGLEGYVDASNNEIVFIAVGAPGTIKPAGKPNHQNIIKMTVPFGIGATTYADLTNVTGGAVNQQPIPPNNIDFWHVPQNPSNWLGGGNYQHPKIAINPNNRNELYTSGGGSLHRSLDGGTTWNNVCNGMGLTSTHDMQFDPADANHMVVCSSDYNHWDFGEDPSGYTNDSITFSTPTPGGANECHCICFGTDSTVYIGQNDKYGGATGGAVFSRPGNSPSGWGSELGYSGPSGGAAAIGIYSGFDTSVSPNKQFLLVVGQGAGMFRGVLSGTSWSWSKLSGNGALIGASGTLAQHDEFVSTTISGTNYIWCLDRKTGLWRSSDFGKTWTSVWSTTFSDAGFVANNTRVAGEIWVSRQDGVYKIANAHTVSGITPTKNAGTNAPQAGGGIACFGGNTYAVWNASSGHNSTSLMMTADGGTTWTDIGGSEIGQYAEPGNKLIINSNGYLVMANALNSGVSGTVVTSIAGGATVAPSPIPARVTIPTPTISAGGSAAIISAQPILASVSINRPPLTITFPESLPTLVIGKTFLNIQFTAFGGDQTSGVTWSVDISGGDTDPLPDGLTLTSGGLLSGTVTSFVGTLNIAFTVTDSVGTVAVAIMQLTVVDIVLVHPRVYVEGAFHADDQGGRVWNDITDFVDLEESSLSFGQRRTTVFDDRSPGTLSFTVDNDNGEFTQTDSDSPFYPNVVNNIPVRIRMQYPPTDNLLTSQVSSTSDVNGWATRQGAVSVDASNPAPGVSSSVVWATGLLKTIGTRLKVGSGDWTTRQGDQPIHVKAGENVSAGVWLKSDSTISISLRIGWYDLTGTLIQEDTSGAQPLTSTWSFVSLEGLTAPSDGSLRFAIANETTISPPTNALSFVNAGTVTNQYVKSQKIDVPDGAGVGDYAAIFVRLSDSTSQLDTPNGWTLKSNTTDLRGRTYWFQNTLQDDDLNRTITLNQSSGHRHFCRMLSMAIVYTGVTTQNVVNAFTTAAETTNSINHVTPNVTTTVSNCRIVSVVMDTSSTNQTWTAPGGESVRAKDFCIKGNACSGIISDNNTVSAVGTYGTKTFSASQRSKYATMITFALHQATGTGPTGNANVSIGAPIVTKTLALPTFSPGGTWQNMITAYADSWDSYWDMDHSLVTFSGTDRSKELASIDVDSAISEVVMDADPIGYYKLDESGNSEITTTQCADSTQFAQPPLTVTQRGNGNGTDSNTEPLQFGSGRSAGVDGAPALIISPQDFANGMYLLAEDLNEPLGGRDIDAISASLFFRSTASNSVQTLTLLKFCPKTASGATRTYLEFFGLPNNYIGVKAAVSSDGGSFACSTQISGQYFDGITRQIGATLQMVNGHALLTLYVNGLPVGSDTQNTKVTDIKTMDTVVLGNSYPKTNRLCQGTYSSVAFWNSALSDDDMDDVYNAGNNAFKGEAVTDRMVRVLDWEDVNGSDFDDSEVLCDRHMPDSSNLLDVLRLVAATDGGTIFINSSDEIAFRTADRRKQISDAALVISAGDLAFPPQAVQDDTLIVNDMTVNRLGVGNSQRVTDVDSIATFGKHEKSIDTLLYSDSEATAMAGYFVAFYAEPTTRFETIDIQCLLLSDLTGVFAAQEMWSIIQVTDMPTTAVRSVVNSFVEGWNWEITADSWMASFDLSQLVPFAVVDSVNDVMGSVVVAK